MSDDLTDLLRADGWVPRLGQPYPCGCHNLALCDRHASIRAAEHYGYGTTMARGGARIDGDGRTDRSGTRGRGDGQ